MERKKQPEANQTGCGSELGAPHTSIHPSSRSSSEIDLVSWWFDSTDVSESPEPSAKLISADGRTSHRAKRGRSRPLRNPPLRLSCSTCHALLDTLIHSHFHVLSLEIRQSLAHALSAELDAPRASLDTAHAGLGEPKWAVGGGNIPRSTRPGAPSPSMPRPGRLHPHLADFVGFGERLTDVQV